MRIVNFMSYKGYFLFCGGNTGASKISGLRQRDIMAKVSLKATWVKLEYFTLLKNTQDKGFSQELSRQPQFC